MTATDPAIAPGRNGDARFANKIEHLLKKGGDPRVLATIAMHEASVVRLNTDSKELCAEAQRIADLVRETAPTVTCGHLREITASELSNRGIQSAYLLTIGRDNETAVCVLTNIAGQNACGIQNAINGKNQKIDEYRRNAQAAKVWLLVVADGELGGVQFVRRVERQTYQSCFDRTLFLEAYEGRCFDLQTRASGSSS